MRHRRWLELVKDYDYKILNHPSKANVVADALSNKVAHSAALITNQALLYQDFKLAEIAIAIGKVTSQLAKLIVQPTLRLRIINALSSNPYLIEKRHLTEAGKADGFFIYSDDGLMFERWLYVPVSSEVMRDLLARVHSSPFFIHPGSSRCTGS
ncbi:pol protein [Cucumis melo var. makuwa]|uniref:Pol protein n=1 Tax=Cucumis melo var. makuwa TaxID=1194695 RepID=A0A5D3C5J2_CUCMM|nr:pol protein [Cucumis melo var. makuwa]TYK05656.1 pol protein [Cucumis melo var. makuwa]